MGKLCLSSLPLGFPSGSDGKESACKVGDLDSIPEVWWSPKEGTAANSSTLAWRNPHGQSSLVGCSSWGHKELDMTEQLSRSMAQLAFRSYILKFLISWVFFFFFSFCNLTLCLLFWQSVQKHSLSSYLLILPSTHHCQLCRNWWLFYGANKLFFLSLVNCVVKYTPRVWTPSVFLDNFSHFTCFCLFFIPKEVSFCAIYWYKSVSKAVKLGAVNMSTDSSLLQQEFIQKCRELRWLTLDQETRASLLDILCS